MRPRAFVAAARTPFASPSRRSKSRCNTPTATARTASARSARCGSSAGTHEHGLTYGRFIDGLNKAGIEIDRKVLSDMAIHEPQAFAALVAKAKVALEYLKNTTPNAFESAVA
jgi:hypothetical protein